MYVDMKKCNLKQRMQFTFILCILNYWHLKCLLFKTHNYLNVFEWYFIQVSIFFFREIRKILLYW